MKMPLIAASSPQSLVVGQRIHCILYGGRDGIIFGIKGEQCPQTISSLGRGVGVCGGRAEFDAVFEDGVVSRMLPESIVRGSVQWRVYDAVATPEQIQEALDFAQAEAIRRKNDEEAKTAALLRRREELLAQYGNTLAQVDPAQSHRAHVIGAKNMVKQLRAAFPGVKFRTRSEYNSIDVTWSNGPTVKQVKAIIDRYRKGSFNGMEDIFEYDDDNVWPALFGGANYVFGHREFGDEFREKLGRALCAAQHVEYQGPRTRNVVGSGDCFDISDHVCQYLAETEIPAGVTDFVRLEDCFGTDRETTHRRCFNSLVMVF